MTTSEKVPTTEQPPSNSLDGALDGGVISHLLSMKSADIALLLQSIESQNDFGDGMNGVASCTAANGTPPMSIATQLACDAQKPMLQMIDRKNSSSFAKLFSMKNADFKAALGGQSVPTPTTEAGSIANVQEVDVRVRANASHPAEQSPSAAGASAANPNDAAEKLSKMRSGDLLDWIWSLEEENLDALLMETNTQEHQLHPGAGGTNTLFSNDLLAPVARGTTGAGQQAVARVTRSKSESLKRKLSEMYMIGDPGNETVKDTPLDTTQVARLLQHQAFLAKRQEEHQQCAPQASPAYPQTATRTQRQQQHQQRQPAPGLTRYESIGTRTALSLFEELVGEAGKTDDHPGGGVKTDAVVGASTSNDGGLVGSLAVALGHKTHSSLYVKNTAGNSTLPVPAPKPRIRTGRKGKSKSDEEIDEDDPVQVQNRDRRRERRLKNKEAAARSRAKKRNYTQSLEDLVEGLKQENAELNEKYRALMAEKELMTMQPSSKPDGGNSRQGLGENDDNENGCSPQVSEKRRKLLSHYFSLPKGLLL